MGRTDRMVEVYRFHTPRDRRFRATTVDSSMAGEGPWHVLAPETAAVSADSDPQPPSEPLAEAGPGTEIEPPGGGGSKGVVYPEAPTAIRAEGLEASLLRSFHLDNQVRKGRLALGASINSTAEARLAGGH